LGRYTLKEKVMHTFKVGDKVRCIKEPCDTQHLANKLIKMTGFVTTTENDLDSIVVKWDYWKDGWRADEGSSYWTVHNDCIEVIKTRFKPGQKVRIINARWSDIKLGSILTVLDDDGDVFLQLKVKLDQGTNYYYWIDYADVELVSEEPESSTFIVIVEEDGKLKPATTPKTYKSHDQAKRVAVEMAERHGGKFLVFRAVLEAEMPKKTKANIKEY
jgi:hypothetical protein